MGIAVNELYKSLLEGAKKKGFDITLLLVFIGYLGWQNYKNEIKDEAREERIIEVITECANEKDELRNAYDKKLEEMVERLIKAVESN